MKFNAKTIAFFGLSTSLALIMAYIEVLIPPLFPSLPGIKMGLPNIIIIFLLYRNGAKTASCVSILRILLVALLFGNAVAFLYSLAGGILSLTVMILLRRSNLFSVVGVSVSGAVMHNVGQILVAMLLLETTELAYYLVMLTFSGVVAGILIGLCGSTLVKKIPKI